MVLKSKFLLLGMAYLLSNNPFLVGQQVSSLCMVMVHPHDPPANLQATKLWLQHNIQFTHILQVMDNRSKP
jgi:hypothetical protein